MDFHDIAEYSDTELFQILDLDNPSNRELEAKLYSLIEISKTKEDMDAEAFYVNVFNHFFEDDDEIYETFETTETKNDPPTPSAPPTFTQNLDYTQGTINPISKETIKRVISIDSSFRELKTYPYSTEFTFNLSETLHDVVSLKLYSIHIPYSWYTINKNYGSNFFYLKGISDGINNGNFDYKINVEYGNYTPLELISTLTTSLNLIKTDNPDVSFGTTSITYNTINLQCTMNLDIANNYNETNYSLEFPYFDTLGNSIPQLFGYITDGYDPFTIHSNIFVFEGNYPVASYTISETNNTFKIYIYNTTFSTTTNNISSFDNTINTPPIDIITVKLTLSTGTNGLYYSVQQIVENLNEVLLLSTEKILISTDASSNSISSTLSVVDASSNLVKNGKKYVLSIRPNRKKTQNRKNQKMIVEFPDESNIWTGVNSCFNFPQKLMELQNIYSEKTSYNTTYLVNTTPFMILKCNAVGYGISSSSQVVSLNDFKIDVSNSSSFGYNLTEYYKAINDGIKAVSNASLGSVTGAINNNNSDYKTQIYFNIENVIPGENFVLDTTDSFLNKLFNFDVNMNKGSYTRTISTSQSYNIDNDNNTFRIKPKDANGKNQYMSIVPVSYTPVGATDMKTITTNLNNLFNTFNQSQLNLTNMSITATEQPDGQHVTLTLVVDIQTILTNTDYDLYLFDTSSDTDNPPIPIPPYDLSYSYDGQSYYWKDNINKFVLTNSWGNNFGFNDPSYSLINISSTNPIITNKSVRSNLLKLDNSNNYFNISPLYDASGGVYSPTNNIQIKLDLAIGAEYTKEAIRDNINKILKNNPVTKGSYINTDNNNTLIRLNVNRTFSAKDYAIVFFDTNNFTKCSFGPNASAETTTIDTTLGWILGFRSNTIYYPIPENVTVLKTGNTNNSYYGESSNTYTYDLVSGIAKLTGDTSVNVNLFNYFLIVLDDYNQSHLNDGLVTTINAETDVPLPSYATTASYRCNPVTGVPSVSNTSNTNRLTNAQIYSSNQILSLRTTQSTQTALSVSSGPYIQDIFGIVPIKISGMKAGDTYTEFGGTLQIQERIYFGPVNIRRMTVKLMTDKGSILDLNNLNWSFSLISEQLYNHTKG